MSTPVWPLALPLPQLASYGVTAQQSFRRSQFETGPSRYRALSTAVPRMVDVSWRVTLEQREIFINFYDASLNHGAEWFEIRLDVGRGLQAYVVHFYSQEAPYQIKPLAKHVWEITAQLEVRSA